MSSGSKYPFMKEMQTFDNDGINKDMDGISKHLEYNVGIDGKKKQNYSKDLRYSSK